MQIIHKFKKTRVIRISDCCESPVFVAVRACGAADRHGQHAGAADGPVGPGAAQPAHLRHRRCQELLHEAQAQACVPQWAHESSAKHG